MYIIWPRAETTAAAVVAMVKDSNGDSGGEQSMIYKDGAEWEETKAFEEDKETSQNTIESVIKKMYYKIHNITMVSPNGHGYGYGHGHKHENKHKHEQNTYKSQRKGTKYIYALLGISNKNGHGHSI